MNAKRPDYSKLSLEERKQKVENLYVRYPGNKAILDKFEYHRQQAKIAAEPEGLLLTGLEGMGKTTIWKFYVASNPRIDTDEGTIVPVLATKVEVPVSPKSLVTAILDSLGDPLPDRGTAVSQTLRLKKMMKECGVELLILDEFQHFIDRDSQKVLKTISDWLKNLMDATNVPIVLIGMPNSHTILDAEGNEQLRRRFSARLSLEPFDWEDPERRYDFRKLLRMTDEMIPLNEWSNLSDMNLAFPIHSASKGFMHRVMKLIRRATTLALSLSREKLDLNLLSLAYEEKLAAEFPDEENPFGDGGKELKKKNVERNRATVRATNNRSKAKEKELRASDIL